MSPFQKYKNYIQENLLIYTSVHTGVVAFVYTHFLNMRDIILISDNIILLS